MFTPHREIIRQAFDRQMRNDNLMLVAELNRFSIGQVWIDLEKKRAERTGTVWARRVFPCLQGLGIGAKLMNAAEEVLRQRHFEAVELGVEKSSSIGTFYERLGYQRIGSLVEEYSYTTPEGNFTRVLVDQHIDRKQL